MNIDGLNPELAAYLTTMEPLVLNDDIAVTRDAWRQSTLEANARLALPEAVDVQDCLIPGPKDGDRLTVRLYRPSQLQQSTALPVLLWLHGGGMMLCSIEDHHQQVARLAHDVGCCIISVDYPLAPEHPYPAALEATYTALRWLFENAETMNIDSQRVAVGGVSAGGNLAAALALLARDRGEFELHFQLLLCPMLDPREGRQAHRRIYDQRIWNRDHNHRAWSAYLHGLDPILPYAAPILASDLDGLPPAYLLVGDQDAFVDETVFYAQALMGSGVPTELHVIPGAFHGFEFLLPEAELSRRVWVLHSQALQCAFCPQLVREAK